MLWLEVTPWQVLGHQLLAQALGFQVPCFLGALCVLGIKRSAFFPVLSF